MKKNNLLIGSFLIYNLISTDKKRYHYNYYDYDYIPYNLPLKAIVGTTFENNSKRNTVVSFNKLNKIGYIISHPILKDSLTFIHTLHIVNYDKSLYAIYKGTSTNIDPNSVYYWQKTVGEYAPRMIKGHIYESIIFW